MNDLILLPKGTVVPNHIAMILDGNRRWARARGLKPWEGHYHGYLAVEKLAKAVRSLGKLGKTTKRNKCDNGLIS